MIDDLAAALQALASDPPRGLLVRADGRVVSGGVDVHLFAGMSSAQGSELWRLLLALQHRLEEMGIVVRTNARAARTYDDASGRGIELADGSRIAGDLIVVCC